MKTFATWLFATLFLWTLATSAAAGPAPVRPAVPVAAHAMVHTCCTPLALKERIFAEAKAMGAGFIRVDVELSAIFVGGAPQWAGLDEVIELSRRYELPVLGVLVYPPGAPAPPDPAVFGRMAGEVAAYAGGTIGHWEIINEPDGMWAFTGTPEDYAHMLRAAYDSIKARSPGAKVGFGALMAHDFSWLERVLATPGADAAHAFDIANINLRDYSYRLGPRLASWRARLAHHGFTGPIWVTETGYPGDPVYQTEPGFMGGEPAQAAFVTESVLSLVEAGASEVFVTLRDNLWGSFLSEGVVAIEEEPPYSARRKPAFAAVRRLINRWGTVARLRVAQRAHEAQVRRLSVRADAAAQRVAALRALTRATRHRLQRLRALRRESEPSVHARLAPRIARVAAQFRRRRIALVRTVAVAADMRHRATMHRLRAIQLAASVAGR